MIDISKLYPIIINIAKMNLETLKGFLRPCREDLELICLDGDKIFLHRILLGFICEFWADLLLENQVQSEYLTTIFVPSDGQKVREALSNVKENPDAFVDTLFGITISVQNNAIETTSESNKDKDLDYYEPGYIGDLIEEKPNIKRECKVDDHEETKEIFLSKNMKSLKTIDAIWKAEKDQQREHKKQIRNERKAEKDQKREHKRQIRNERLEKTIHEKARKREQAEIRRKEREEMKREQTECEIYTCESCGKTYSNQTLLQNHIKRMHTEPMKCSECDFKTPYTKRLAEHKMRHEGTIYHTCQICGTKLLGSSYLRKHMLLVHEKRDKTTCPEPSCGKSVLAYYLKQHLKNHRQERKFKCEDCDYKARDGFNLKLHRGKMHNDNPLVKEQCDHCEVKTTNMNNHIKSFHPDIYWNFKN